MSEQEEEWTTVQSKIHVDVYEKGEVVVRTGASPFVLFEYFAPDDDGAEHDIEILATIGGGINDVQDGMLLSQEVIRSVIKAAKRDGKWDESRENPRDSE